MTKVKRKVKRVPGDIVRIDLGNGWHTYGRVLLSTIGIYDSKTKNDLPIEEIVLKPLLFQVWVMDYAIKDGTWPVVGHQDFYPIPPEEPYFYKQDSISGKLYITKEGAGDEVPTTFEECQHLECAAVWDPEHVVGRIVDYYDGTPSKVLKSLAIDKSKIPQ